MWIHIYIHMHESTCESVINSGRYGWNVPHTRTHSWFFFLSTTWLSSVSCRVSQNRTAPLCMVEREELCFLHIHTATHCNTLQHIATHCNALQHITHCNTLHGRARQVNAQKSPFILNKRAHISRQEESYVFCKRADISGNEPWAFPVTAPKSAMYTQNIKDMKDMKEPKILRPKVLFVAPTCHQCAEDVSSLNTYRKWPPFQVSKSAKICLKRALFVAFHLHSDCGWLIACGEWKHNTKATPESADYSKCNAKEPCVICKRALISCKRALRLLQKGPKSRKSALCILPKESKS